jgi:uncharacterized protein (DUF1501 family)
MLSRRGFLQSSALLALAPTVPGFLARTGRAAEPNRDARVLVVIELNGGNDGINTIVPFADEGYARHRKTLRLPTDKLLKITDRIGFHPAMRDAAKLLETGRLVIVQGVGYPNPNRSHFESMAIWQTARLNPKGHKGPGWVASALDNGPSPADGAPASLLVGLDAPPRALMGGRAATAALANLDDWALSGPIDPKRALQISDDSGHQERAARSDLQSFVARSMLDAYATADHFQKLSRIRDGGTVYPATALAERLRLVAQLLKAGYGTRVFYMIQGGYDTHFTQLANHADLLSTLAGAVRAFLEDLHSARLADRVAVLTFSEFGRRVAENDSLGTDHGTAAPIFLAGTKLKPGLVGTTPSLIDLQDDDLKMSIDFRRVYATVLEEWLELPAHAVLGGTFEPLQVFGSSSMT